MSETTATTPNQTTKISGVAQAAQAMPEVTTERPPEEDTIDRLFRKKPGWLPYAMVIAAVGVVLGLLLMGAVWVFVIPWLWNSLLVEPVKGLPAHPLELLKLIPGIIGIVFIPLLSVWLPGLPIVLVNRILRLYAETADQQIAGKVQDIRREQSELETALEQSDHVGLVPLVRYSRKQLEAYYTIALNQTQRSFAYSVIAMWLGFAVILAGLIYQVLPLAQLFPDIGVEKNADIKVVALAGGIVIEIISALFLWVYRSSIQQLNYYYDRQMHIHDVIFCYRMAASLKESKESDGIVRLIIEEVLKHAWKKDEETAPSGKVVAELFSKGEPKPAA
jgi:hypothetical protein